MRNSRLRHKTAANALFVPKTDRDLSCLTLGFSSHSQLDTVPLMVEVAPKFCPPENAAPIDARHRVLRESLKGRWLARIRWAVFACFVLVATAVVVFLDIRSDLGALSAIFIVGAVSNTIFGVLLSRDTARATRLGGCALSLDVVLLAALLYLYGGYANPFSMIFLVYVTFAAFFLNARWTWCIFLLSSALFVALFFFHVPLDQLSVESEHAAMGHASMDRGNHGGFSLHLHGMLVAFLVIGLLTAIFLGRLSRELEAQAEQLDAMAKREQERQQLMALASLTAGAAHELATPLGTLTLISEDLERALGRSEEWSEDVTLMRSELARCEKVLSRMRGQSVELAGEVPARTTVEIIFRRVEEELRPGESVRFETADSSHIPLKTLQTSLVSSLAALVRNGLQACSGQESVLVEARRAGESIVFSVRDRGEGIAPDVLKRVGSPFFTTKNPGQGLGLGVFLVKLFALQVGGNFSLSSVPGQGSEARLVVPMEVSA